jgi:hypothetical protein
VHTRFGRWLKSGVIEIVCKYLAKNTDNECVMIYSSIVRAHQHSAVAKKGREAQSIGRSKGILSKKTTLLLMHYVPVIQLTLF